MGVNISVPLTAEVAAQLDLPVTSGVLVSGTYSGTPAEEAGIGQGDVIVAIDGEQVADAEDLSEILSARDPGDEIEVRLVNASGERTVTLTLEQRPEVFE
jgi:serine protease Do